MNWDEVSSKVKRFNNFIEEQYKKDIQTAKKGRNKIKGGSKNGFTKTEKGK